jgi:hypothetical protein
VVKRLHTLMQRFAALEGARVGYGPKHPTDPDPTIAEQLEAFVGRHPFLRDNRAYLAFLECYGGASVIRRDETDFIDISGFHGFGLDLEDDAPPAYQRGWFTFSVFSEGYDAGTGKRGTDGQFDFKVESWAVYLRLCGERVSRRKWFASDFLTWLESMVRHGGSVAGWVAEPGATADGGRDTGFSEFDGSGGGPGC